MQDILERFGIEVRRKRKKLNLTQEQLAGKLNMSNRTIMDIENAKIVPQLDTVVYIARELGIIGSITPISAMLLQRDSILSSV